jgi:hypothetical protein
MKRDLFKQAVVVAVMVISPALVLAATPPDPVNKTQVMNKAYLQRGDGSKLPGGGSQ